MRIAILGYGDQGESALEYWNRDGNEITVCDQDNRLELPKDVKKQLGHDYLKNLGGFDLLIRTPALHPGDIVANNPHKRGILDKVTTNTEEFMSVCPTKNIIGVTGTKGKGTTSSLIAKILEAAGKTAHLGGNIGIPPLDMLKNGIKPDDWVVLELANYQLIDLKTSPHIAVCLMVVPEHLDWHTDVEEYVEAKQKMFKHQSKKDIAIYYARNEDSLKVASASPGKKIPYMSAPGAEVKDGQVMIAGKTICATADLKLLGRHNWQNVCGAVTAAWQVTQDTKAIAKALTSFTGLPHRLELVREIGAIKYYDDSFGTTLETAIVAIQAFTEPKVLILGGSDKGADFTELARAVARGNVRSAVTIGLMGPTIAQALRSQGFSATIEGGKTMPEIVAAASNQAQPGDIVLLSTACASFDMFDNYQDRGDKFRAAVNSL